MLYQCVFRNEKPPHYHAFITANDVDELFLAIDEYGSPYECEIYECDFVSFCVKVVDYCDVCPDDEYLEGELAVDYSEIEIGELTQDLMTSPPTNQNLLPKTKRQSKTKP